uniref:ST3 beta-galactoside alpha-2,3-sialyltransferase 1 n=1 Tax=Pygocentrus nattereri TaxID=42514 RepID=A0A3B4DYX7_PYGNA
MVAFVTLVPALCRSFIRSLRVVLGFLFTVLMIILTPRDWILRGAPDQGRLSMVLYVFHFLTIAPTVDFIHTNLPAYCRFTLPSLVKVYNFLPGVLRQPTKKNYSAVVETLFSLFPDEEHYSDAGPHRCRTCAVVGNSGNLKGSHYGPLIDAHDVVIRMNKAPIAGFEKDVGLKTTHHAIYPESAVDMDNSTHLVLVPFKILDLEWLISVFTTKHITAPCLLLKVMILHPEFMKYVSEIWLKQKGKYPSTGFIMLVFSLHICDQVNVFGFGASKNGNWYHYFDKRYRHHLNTGHHKGSAEYNITLTLSLKNKIQMYKGW